MKRTALLLAAFFAFLGVASGGIALAGLVILILPGNSGPVGKEVVMLPLMLLAGGIFLKGSRDLWRKARAISLNSRGHR
jgi:hypothetical protein